MSASFASVATPARRSGSTERHSPGPCYGCGACRTFVVTSLNASPSTVVVVEDDPAISDLVALYLRRDGHTVVQAADGELALQVLDTHRPHVLVLDVGLPGIDGLEVCRRVRARNDAVAVIFLTARDDEVDRVLGLELGADDYVTKPFSPRELAARVKAILRRAGRSGAGGAMPIPAASCGRRRRGRSGASRGQGRRRGRRHWLPRSSSCWHASPATGAWPCPDANCWTGRGGTAGSVTSGPSTSTSRQLRRKLGAGVTLSTVRGVGYRLD